MQKKKFELTDGEWTIFQVLWENSPRSAPDVQEEIQKNKNWAYSTVKTTMDRMVAKGLLKTQRLRNLILYSPAITRKQAQSGEIMRTVKRAFNGAMTPMMQFMLDNNNLPQEQLKQLEELIKSRRNKDRAAKRK
ncbi:MAG: BlaI/MecI/CopY family transcriptional regulator [Sedimentisphaerales bacterium]|nr:BlaI/MecI/CopY family transcriptional regulator [Sedimentisphaerales bacterium]